MSHEEGEYERGRQEMREDLVAQGIIFEPDPNKVEAQGSVVKIYFPKGETPSAEWIAGATGAVSVEFVVNPQEPAFVTPINREGN